MKKIIAFAGLLVAFSFFFQLKVKAEESKTIVFKVAIKDEIGPKVWRTASKAFEKAGEEGADYIILHMNTYGGLVVYADSLRTLILNSKIPVWVFIDNNAASAGALISIACEKIYMREGANIGAATVVNQSGQAMPDKYQSYMRAMIRSTAQAHGKDTIVSGRDTLYRWKRDPEIAEAMVDENIYIEGISDSGKIVTFTPHEAMKYGYCDGIAASIEEVLEMENISEYTISEYKPTLLDTLISFFMHPMVQGLLIMAIIGGIYFELQTPGIGFPLILAITACVLYFAPLYLEGIAAHWELILFILGVVLLLLEVFVLPGFGVAGVTGIVLIISSLVSAGIDSFSFEYPAYFFNALLHSLFVVFSGSVLALFLSIWIGKHLITSKKWAFALHAEQRKEEGYVGVDMEGSKEISKLGVAMTDLRPSGKVIIGGEVYDAVADQGEFIEKGVTIKVLSFQSGQLYVEKNRN